MTGRSYRRASHLLIEFDGPDVVLVHCDTMRRFRVDAHLITVLAALHRPRPLTDLIANEGGERRTDLDKLLELRLIEPAAENDSAAQDRDGYWNAFELAVHRMSNTGGYRPEQAAASATPPPALFKPRQAGHVTSLPPPVPVMARSFSDVLTGRRSRRTYGNAPLRLEDLSSLLFHSARIQRTGHNPTLGDFALRPFAGGGARSELEIYVIANAVKSLAAGAHHYDPQSHELVQIREHDAHQRRLSERVHAAAAGLLNRDPAVILLITAVFSRVMWKYRGLGLSIIYKDTGCLLQTLYLVSTALDLAPCAIGGGDERANSEWLGLDPMVESQVGCFLVGPQLDATGGRTHERDGAGDG